MWTETMEHRHTMTIEAKGLTIADVEEALARARQAGAPGTATVNPFALGLSKELMLEWVNPVMEARR